MVIVGAGFSGTLQAINLLRDSGPRVTLVERSSTPGLGVAYGAASAVHLLNVRAKGMSALPDDKDGFTHWLAERHPDLGPDSFVPRLVYGEYLARLLGDARTQYPGRLTICHGLACAIDTAGNTATVTLADGGRIEGDVAILAVGNLPPHDPPGFGPGLPGELYQRDPWAGSAIAPGDPDGTVLLLGTGLTMVDVALLLRKEGFAGPIIALSRRGLLPHRHADQPMYDPIDQRPPVAASALVRSVRGRADAVGWRNAVDELRPFTASMWRATGDEEKARFLRHLRPWWDIHRHRLAPTVSAEIEEMVSAGSLSVRAGRTIAARVADGRLDVDYRGRGDVTTTTLAVAKVINCTGPQGNLLATEDRLLETLLEEGTIRPDAMRIGIDVDVGSRVIGKSGQPNDRLYAIGPMTRGATWEIVAVPDIRRQVWSLSRRLCNAHWVGGEGL